MNLRPPDPKSGALTKLRYTPVGRLGKPNRFPYYELEKIFLTEAYLYYASRANKTEYRYNESFGKSENPSNENRNKKKSHNLRSSPRPISTGLLNTLPYLHSRPIYLVVCKGPYSLLVMGNLILRTASRLDAFSVYPFRIWLLCHAAGPQQIHQ